MGQTHQGKGIPKPKVIIYQWC